MTGKHCNKPLKNIVKIGYIPETPSLYEELTLKEHIEVTALAYDIPLEEAFKRAEPLLKTFRLDNKLEWFPANFSKGMKQKSWYFVHS